VRTAGVGAAGRMGIVALLAAACPGKGDGPGRAGSGVPAAGSNEMTTSGSTGSGSGSGSGSARPPMPEVANAGPGFLYVKAAAYEGVIASTGAPWTPSPRQVAELEVVLGPAIEAHELGKAFPAATFKREYRGAQDGAHKTIVIRLACQVDADWPERGLPSVKGGGACYGRAEYDVASGAITALTANSGK